MYHHHTLCIDELKMQKKMIQNLCMQLSEKGIAICLDVHCFIVNVIIFLSGISSGTADNVTLPPLPPLYPIPASPEGSATIEGNVMCI